MKQQWGKRFITMVTCAGLCTSLLPGTALAAVGTKPAGDRAAADHTVYGFLTEAASKVETSGGYKLQVKMIPAGTSEAQTYVTDYVYTEHNDKTGADYVDLLVNECTAGSFCEVLYDAAGKIVDVHQVLDASQVGFDTAQYGGDLTAQGGGSGKMVAKGWLYGMDDAAGTITVGDGNHVTNVFEEKYKVTDQTKVYLVDDGYRSEVSNLAAVKANYVTKTDGNGDIYLTEDRYAAVCVFADDYKTPYTSSHLEELYVYKTPYKQEEKYRFVPDDAPNHSDYRENNDALNKDHMPEQHPELTSAEPFCLMKDKLYWIGDDEVTCLLLVNKNAAGANELTVLDLGWPESGYQYMRNIEKLGFDPRDVKTLALTHGHLDHYGAAQDFVDMNQRVGVEMKVYESLEDTLGYVNFKNDEGGDWNIPGALNDATARYLITDYFPEHEWFSFNDNNTTKLYAYLNTGHSTGALSFVIHEEATAQDEYFKKGDTVEFSYMGGYGAMGSVSKGYLRNAFEYSLRYIQSYIAPMMEKEADYIYCIPQHTNHYPIMEVNKAYKKINAGKTAGDSGYVPMMACMEEGADAIINQLEKRLATQVYDSYFQAWAANPKPIGYATDPLSATDKVTGSAKNYQTNDKYGPFKRSAGTYQIEVLSDTADETGIVMHGYNAWLNPSDYFKGLTNLDGEDLSKGFVIEKDAYVHDPNAWYVQLCVHVKDGYTGNIKAGTVGETAYPGGPVESLQGDGWFEIIRTERLNSKAEAEALLATLKSGKTYTVTLDASSEIQLADNLTSTFGTLPASGYTDVADSHWASGAVSFVTGRGLFVGVPGGNFEPEGSMDRSMLATVLQRFAEGAGQTSGTAFTDVTADAWYHGAISWASANGVMNGASAAAFAPTMAVSREQLATTLYRFAKFRGEDMSTKGNLAAFPDASSVSSWATEAMTWAVGAGVITGTEAGLLAPQANASRSQVAAVLQRTAGLWDTASKVVAKELPRAEDMKINLDDYYGQVLHGYYNFNCVVSPTVTRTAKFYIPEGTVYNQPTVFVGVPNGVDTWEFLVQSGWKDLADKKIFHVVLMEPENGKWGDKAAEVAYIDALNTDVSYRPFFCAFSSNFYGIGYGESADILQAQSVNSPKSWAGIALLGASGMTADEVNALRAAPSKVPGVTLAQVQTPAWITADSKTADVQRMVDFYKSANHSQSAKSGDRYADEVYLPQAGGTVDDEWCANTVFDAARWADCVNKTYSEQIYTGLFEGVYRYPGDANGALRRPGEIFARGFQKFEAKVPGGYAADGSDLYNREWYVYVPSSVDTSKPAPVVFVFHGAGGSGNEIADRSGWAKVADEKGIILICPTGSHTLSVRKVSDMVTNELFRAMWNTGDATAEQPSDLKFVEYLYNWVKANYKIDTSRVYASGQSSGGMMTWACAAKLPNLFAAVAPVSATRAVEPVANAMIPIMAFIGEKDTTFPGGFGSDDGKKAIGYWTERDNTVETWGDYTYMDGGKDCSFQDGLFTNYVFSTKTGVPMLRAVEVATKTHAIWPSECFMAWNEWFSNFTKDVDSGVLYYQGKPVSSK